MLITMNITNTDCDLSRYRDGDDLKAFLDEHALDGVEVLPYQSDDMGLIRPESIIGLHLSYHPFWVDYWMGNASGILREFGEMSIADRHFGGKDGICERLIRELDLAARIGVKYVVFHVSDVSIAESVSYRFSHTDEEVIDVSCELINTAMRGRLYGFDFLVENLWWPGFSMTRPEMTARLLSGIEYVKTGIMLDTGHLLHTNRDLRTEAEGVDYILQTLDAHGALADRIYGVHLHQSLSGAYVDDMIGNPPNLHGNYIERLGSAYEYILNIDTHRPFTDHAASKLIRRIQPRYLTHEFITIDREEHARFLRVQSATLN